MDADPGALPDDIDALKTALMSERAKAQVVAAELAVARAKASANQQIGTASSLDVYEAQQGYYTAEQTLVSKYLSREINLVTLYKVLGGSIENTVR